LQAVSQALCVTYLQGKFSMVATASWNSQETGSKPSSTYERVELLGDSHYKVETRPRDLNTVVTSRIK
jgi:uncharacterized protein (DUF608 family)